MKNIQTLEKKGQDLVNQSKWELAINHYKQALTTLDSSLSFFLHKYSAIICKCYTNVMTIYF